MSDERVDEVISMSEEEFNARLNWTHFAGIASAYESLHMEFLKLAGDAFARGDDVRARFLRDELVPLMKKRAEEALNGRERCLKEER